METKYYKGAGIWNDGTRCLVIGWPRQKIINTKLLYIDINSGLKRMFMCERSTIWLQIGRKRGAKRSHDLSQNSTLQSPHQRAPPDSYHSSQLTARSIIMETSSSASQPQQPSSATQPSSTGPWVFVNLFVPYFSTVLQTNSFSNHCSMCRG